MDRKLYAYELFLQGCNCSQAVFCAFCDLFGMESDAALKLASGFGGGLGRLRETCGAVSGMVMAASAIYGYNEVNDHTLKSDHYRLIQKLCLEFEERAGSLTCRELLGIEGHSEPESPPRTAEFYKTRPCPGLITLAAEILEKYISEHPND